jgi:hypothetical protein
MQQWPLTGLVHSPMSHHNRTRTAREENGPIDPSGIHGLRSITRTARTKFAYPSELALDLRYEG